MTFLLDANLSPHLVGRLINSGYEATHVADLGLLTAPDEVIFDHAAEADLIVITAATDFSMLLDSAEDPDQQHRKPVARFFCGTSRAAGDHRCLAPERRAARPAQLPGA